MAPFASHALAAVENSLRSVRSSGTLPAMSDIILDKSGPVATLTFNKPDKANAFDPAWIPSITEFVTAVEHDAAVRCLLIRGNGKHFMAGGDLGSILDTMKKKPSERGLETAEPIHQFNVLGRAMRRLNKPTVASVHGAVAGAAVGIAAACDLVIAADTSFFFVAHVLHGGSVDGLTSYYLPRQIGVRKTMELALLADRIGAAEAQRIGLVNFVVPADKLAAETDALVQRLASGPTKAYAIIRNEVLSSLDHSLEEHGRLEAEGYAAASATSDWIEGLQAFFDKRKATFTGQ
jgi:2-(1,2-epoxy-1,2-dihydrophenyl)acetyl-CoA isomerase